MVLDGILNGRIIANTIRKHLPRNSKRLNNTPRSVQLHHRPIQIQLRLDDTGKGAHPIVRLNPDTAFVAFDLPYELPSTCARCVSCPPEEIRQDAAREKAGDDEVVGCFGCDGLARWFATGIENCDSGIERGVGSREIDKIAQKMRESVQHVCDGDVQLRCAWRCRYFNARLVVRLWWMMCRPFVLSAIHMFFSWMNGVRWFSSLGMWAICNNENGKTPQLVESSQD